MDISNVTSLDQRQEQRQQLSARTLQSLELLHLPLQELETRLTRELEVNPDFQCHHHDRDAGHKCGEHGCGEHKCGGGHCH